MLFIRHILETQRQKQVEIQGKKKRNYENTYHRKKLEWLQSHQLKQTSRQGELAEIIRDIL